MNTKLIVAGHSHTQCLGLIDQKTKALSEVELVENKIYGVKHAMPPPANFLRGVVSMSKGAHVAFFWQGNFHLAKFLFSTESCFDFIRSTRTDLPVDSSVNLVPESMVEQAFEKPINNLKRALDVFKAEESIKSITLVCPPPPKSDDEFIKSNLDIIFKDRGLASTFMASKWVRLKLWDLMAELYKRAAELRGFHFLPPPKGAADDEGFLDRSLWASDATHANKRYGNIILSQLEAHYSFLESSSQG